MKLEIKIKESSLSIKKDNIKVLEKSIETQQNKSPLKNNGIINYFYKI